jgi:hypothetical protein
MSVQPMLSTSQEPDFSDQLIDLLADQLDVCPSVIRQAMQALTHQGRLPLLPDLPDA